MSDFPRCNFDTRDVLCVIIIRCSHSSFGATRGGGGGVRPWGESPREVDARVTETDSDVLRVNRNAPYGPFARTHTLIHTHTRTCGPRSRHSPAPLSRDSSGLVRPLFIRSHLQPGFGGSGGSSSGGGRSSCRPMCGFGVNSQQKDEATSLAGDPPTCAFPSAHASHGAARATRG